MLTFSSHGRKIDYSPIVIQSICTVILLFVVHHKVNSLEKYNITIISLITSRPHENGAEIGMGNVNLFLLLSSAGGGG